MKSQADLKYGERKIESFLTHLARERNISPSTQNQAMNALVFHYKHVLKHPLDQTINDEHAPRRVKIPVVLTREETAQVITRMWGIHQIAAKLLYGSGLRITEYLRLRVQDIDFAMRAVTVRSSKGKKDRISFLKTILLGVFFARPEMFLPPVLIG